MHILIVEDDECMSRNVAAILAKSGMGSERSRHGEEGARLGRERRFDMIILDLTLPDIHGLRVLRELRASDVDTPVLVLSGDDNVDMRVTCLESGADDFLIKPFHASELIARIRALERHAIVHARAIGEAREALVRLEPLTAREREVLAKLLAGCPNKAVAHQLGISPRTVEVHRANIMEKLNARSLTEVVRVALAAARITDSYVQ